MWMILYLIRERSPIQSYAPNIRDDVRITYLEKGPVNHIDMTFQEDRGGMIIGRGSRGGHIFIKIGFRDWKHKKTLKYHVGLFDSAHNQRRPNVTDTCAQSLKAIDAIFSTYGLSIYSLRGQGSDGISNMSVVFMARRNCMLGDFFNILAVILNLLNIGELSGGRSQFQEMSLARLDVLKKISKNGINSDKKSMANLRDNGWDTLLSRVIEFYVDRHILLPNMEDIGDLYCHVIDSILQKLNDRFPETITEFFTCISCLSPKDSFAAFDKAKLICLAQLYHLDFNNEELLLFRPQLDKFFILVRMDEAFFNLDTISYIKTENRFILADETYHRNYFLDQ
ncbi:uncharacterized protein LOC111398344 [Olea europaea var. sylvestris]|uniref:uncharacterized protein LOC111398344 n=1 Tax=Olea europaea var. sylvestris TaxID=158386 RepID=UPI000C1D83D8|nr:uncharacterized protein LOC111398344 [Olea europaea var. sylvestris]